MADELRPGLLEHPLGEIDAGDLVAVGREQQGDVPAAGADVEHGASALGERVPPGPRPGLALSGQGQAGELVLVVLGDPAGPVAVPGLLVHVGGAGHRGVSWGSRASGASGAPWASRPRKRNWTVPSAAIARSAATA